MKASELRIGNLVWLKSKSMPYVISSGHDIEEIDDAPEGFDAVPVELTEEWLTILGFKQVGFNFENKQIILHRNNKTGTFDFLLNEPHSHKLIVRVVEYVHTLQNLCHALTGEELTFNTNEK